MMKGSKIIRKNNKIEIFDGDTLTLMQVKWIELSVVYILKKKI
jgi:hypothetical protein